jgi:hypothetical protein
MILLKENQKDKNKLQILSHFFKEGDNENQDII